MMSRVTTVAQGDQIGWIIATATSARYEVVDVCLASGAWASAALTCVAISGKNHCPGASPAISRLWAALVHASRPTAALTCSPNAQTSPFNSSG